MKRIAIRTVYKKLLSDVFTPVGIYLRVRDRFRDTILLESTDAHVAENSFSFICINAVAGIEVRNLHTIEFKLPDRDPERVAISAAQSVPSLLWEFMQRMDVQPSEEKVVRNVQGLFGYTCFDGVQFFDTIRFNGNTPGTPIPLMRYRLYQYVIAIDHFKDELYLCENIFGDREADLAAVESLIRSKDVPVYPFATAGAVVP